MDTYNSNNYEYVPENRSNRDQNRSQTTQFDSWVERIGNTTRDTGAKLVEIARTSISNNADQRARREITETTTFSPTQAANELRELYTTNFNELDLIQSDCILGDPEMTKELDSLRKQIADSRQSVSNESAQICFNMIVKEYGGLHGFLTSMGDSINRVMPNLVASGITGAVTAGAFALTGGLGAIPILLAGTGTVATAITDRFSKGMINRQEPAQRMFSPGNLLVSHKLIQSYTCDLSSNSLSLADLPRAKDMADNLKSEILFSEIVAKSNSTSSYLGNMNLDIAKKTQNILNYRLLELVKELEARAIGAKDTVTDTIGNVISIVPSKYDLIQIDYELKQILPLFTGDKSGSPVIKNLQSLLAPQIAPDKLMGANFSEYSLKVDTLVSNADISMSDFRSRIGGSDSPTLEEMELTIYKADAASCATDRVLQANYSGPWSFLEPRELVIGASGVEKILGMDAKVTAMRTKLDKFRPVIIHQDVLRNVANLEQLANQVNNFDSSGLPDVMFKEISTDLKIYHHIHQLSYDHLRDSKRDPAGIFRQLLNTPTEFAKTLDESMFSGLSELSRNILQHKMPNGEAIDSNHDFKSLPTPKDLTDAVVDFLNLQNPDIITNNHRIVEYIMEIYPNAWYLQNYIEPKTDAIIANLVDKKVKTEAEYSAEISAFKSELTGLNDKPSSLADEFNNLKFQLGSYQTRNNDKLNEAQNTSIVEILKEIETILPEKTVPEIKQAETILKTLEYKIKPNGKLDTNLIDYTATDEYKAFFDKFVNGNVMRTLSFRNNLMSEDQKTRFKDLTTKHAQIIKDFEILNTNPQMIIQNFSTIQYRQLRKILGFDTSFGKPEFSPPQMVKIRTTITEMKAAIAPLTKLEAHLSSDLLANYRKTQQIIDSAQLIVDYRDEAGDKSSVTHFVDWGWDDNFAKYETLENRLKPGINFLQKLKGLEPNLPRIFKIHFEKMKTQLTEKIEWYKTTLRNKMQAGKIDYPWEKEIKLYELIPGFVGITDIDDPFAAADAEKSQASVIYKKI